MSWKDQGRQYHMWFGHGTAVDNATKAAHAPSVTGKTSDERALALAYGAIAALPAALRGRAESQYQYGTLARLKEAMTAWIRGTRLDQATFASRFFGRAVDDPVARTLHAAALDAATAATQEEMRDAAGHLAEAIKTVGIDQWPRFVADAADRASNPATQAAIENSRRPPDPARDAIRPVYPVETALGVGAVGIAGGVGAAARAVGGAILRQFAPESRPPAGSAPTGGTAASGNSSGSSISDSKQSTPNASATPITSQKPPISRQKQDGHIAGTPQYRNRVKLGKPTSVFYGSPSEADALTQEAWQKGTPLPKEPNIREHNFGRPIGTGGYGGRQFSVRVYQDSAGRIHGHPVGREIP